MLYFLLTADFNHLTFQKLITKHWSGYGWSGQYFFIILFQLVFIFPLLSRLYNTAKIRYTILLTIVMLYIFYGYNPNIFYDFWLKLGDRPFFYWIPYVFIGIFAARNPQFLLPISTGFLILLIPVESILMTRHSNSYSAYISPAVMISSIALILSVINRRVFPSTLNSNVYKLFKLVGLNTMGIFVMNPLVILFLNKIQYNSYSNINTLDNYLTFFTSFVITVMIVIFCLTVTITVRKTRFAFLMQ